jgi:hypothetical protein
MTAGHVSAVCHLADVGLGLSTAACSYSAIGPNWRAAAPAGLAAGVRTTTVGKLTEDRLCELTA